MFDFGRQLRGEEGTTLRESREVSLEQQQRDIFETHRHRIFSVGFYMTANECEAEVMLADTFIHAFRAAPVPGPECIDQALLQELEQRLSLAPASPAIPEQGSALAQGQVRRTDLEEALPILPPRERLIFLLRDVEGYPDARIAGLLRCEEAEIQKTLISARIRMRNALASQRRSRMAAALAHPVEQAAVAVSSL